MRCSVVLLDRTTEEAHLNAIAICPPDSRPQASLTRPKIKPFEVLATTPGSVQLQVADGDSGYPSVIGMTPAQIDKLIKDLTRMRRSRS